ncbi:MAG: reductive dehalogenase [Alphaproteobacteria bacterium]|jgi:epoxyqueuosine reductase|nr:reductive dehalogenase [Alphaproteobacteria bacterium]
MTNNDASKSAANPLSIDNPPTSEGPYQGPIHDPRDEVCNFEILDNFERFNKNNDIYNRGRWDERIMSKKVIDWFRGMYRPDIAARNRDGYTAKDFAFRLGGWVGTNLLIERNIKNGRVDGYQDDIEIYSSVAKHKVEIESPEIMSEELKRVAKLFGAEIIGITSQDERWHYSHWYDADHNAEKPANLPEGLVNTIIIGTTMDHDIIKTYPSATAGTAVGYGYSKDASTMQAVGTFIQGMGYRAVASLNDTAQKVPYAIQAGLGENGRHSMLITPEFGPRVRICQIFTDMPLAHDQPKRWGIKEFCEICNRCAQACPPGAIQEGGPTDQTLNISNQIGIRKWSINNEKCFKFWTNQGTDCGICIRVCPYNMDTSTWLKKKYFRFWVWLAGTHFRRLALWLDVKFIDRERKEPAWWWRGGKDAE